MENLGKSAAFIKLHGNAGKIRDILAGHMQFSGINVVINVPLNVSSGKYQYQSWSTFLRGTYMKGKRCEIGGII